MDHLPVRFRSLCLRCRRASIAPLRRLQFVDSAVIKCTTPRGAGPRTLFAIASSPTNGEATVTLLPSFQEGWKVGDRRCILRASGHYVHVTVLPHTVSFRARSLISTTGFPLTGAFYVAFEWPRRDEG